MKVTHKLTKKSRKVSLMDSGKPIKSGTMPMGKLTTKEDKKGFRQKGQLLTKKDKDFSIL